MCEHCDDQQPTLLEMTCAASGWLNNLIDNYEFESDDVECQLSLHYLTGALDACHALLHQGAILAPESENYIQELLDLGWEWAEQHGVAPAMSGEEN